MIALLGDAEFDEGNVFEALLESWKHDIRDRLVDHRLQPPESRRRSSPIGCSSGWTSIFRDMEWDVVTLKYGRLLEQAFTRRGGDALRDWIDACPNAALFGAGARRRRAGGRGCAAISATPRASASCSMSTTTSGCTR